jgi:LysR family glycine cleavage system transcriptional activator
LHQPCEQHVSDQIDWARWLAAVGASEVDARQGPRFSLSYKALQAAAADQGIALASSAYLADDLTARRLVRPFGDLSVEVPLRFFIVCPDATADSEKVAAFRNWALEEASRGV